MNLLKFSFYFNMALVVVDIVLFLITSEPLFPLCGLISLGAAYIATIRGNYEL